MVVSSETNIHLQPVRYDVLLDDRLALLVNSHRVIRIDHAERLTLDGPGDEEPPQEVGPGRVVGQSPLQVARE